MCTHHVCLLWVLCDSKPAVARGYLASTSDGVTGPLSKDPATGQNISTTRVPYGWEEWWALIQVGFFNVTASDQGVFK